MNAFSERFARILFAAYPAWEGLVREPRGEEQSGALYLDVPRGEGDEIVLGITTEHDEVTVFFDGWHEHFGSWTGASEDEAFRAALASIAAILADEVLSMLVKTDGTWKWSSAIAPDEAVELGEGETAHITSWSGKLDRVVTSTEGPTPDSGV